MASVHVHAPVSSYCGTSAGVEFTDGVGVVDAANTSALRYFTKAGYHLEHPPTQAPPAAAPVVEAQPAAPPPLRAPKDAWVAHAVSCGMASREAARATKATLVALYGAP